MSRRLSSLKRFLPRLSSRRKQPEFTPIAPDSSSAKGKSRSVGRARTAAAKFKQAGLKDKPQRRISITALADANSRGYVLSDEFSKGSDEISLGSSRGTRTNSSSYYSAEQEEHSDDNGQKEQTTNAATLIQAQVRRRQGAKKKINEAIQTIYNIKTEKEINNVAKNLKTILDNWERSTSIIAERFALDGKKTQLQEGLSNLIRIDPEKKENVDDIIGISKNLARQLARINFFDQNKKPVQIKNLASNQNVQDILLAAGVNETKVIAARKLPIDGTYLPEFARKTATLTGQVSTKVGAKVQLTDDTNLWAFLVANDSAVAKVMNSKGIKYIINGGKNTRKNKKYGRKNRGGSLRKNKRSSRKKKSKQNKYLLRKNLKHSKKKN